MDLQSPNQHQHREHRSSKSYHVVPHDDPWLVLQEPLATASASNSDDLNDRIRTRTKSKRALLATSRIERDKLMRVMEDLILREAELASAYELFAYTRTKCISDHDEIVGKLGHYERLLEDAKQQEERMRLSGVESVLKSQQEIERWKQTQIMVQSTLPEMLHRLEESIDVNGAKIRNIQEKMDEIRAQRLSIREEIAEKEEDIALALASK